MGPEGLEPSTLELKVPCSAAELRSRVEVRGIAGFYRHLDLVVACTGIEPACSEERRIYSPVRRPLPQTSR